MNEVAAILLAAGLSRRMGQRNKLLLPVGGTPMVRSVAEAYLAVIDTPLTVVTGFEADKVRDALVGLPVTFAHNSDHTRGQPSSVATGLGCAPNATLLLIGLADQPRLAATDLAELIRTHRIGHPDKITVPMHGEQRGNPIVVPHSVRWRLTQNPDRPGCMRFTRDHPEHVQTAILNAPGFYADVDTPADYAALMRAEDERAT
ncbi:MAG: nucleotidyltransferase family protein [Pseudomonadota bacterium]